MSEFKFNCPGCGQHILANEEWGGRRINCPSCNEGITVPSPAKKPKRNAPVMPPTQGARPKLPGGLVPTNIPARQAGTVTTPAPAPPALEKKGQAATTSPAKDPKEQPPAMPPAPRGQPKLPAAELPGKEGGAIIAPAPTRPAPEKQAKLGKTPPAKGPKENAPPAMPAKPIGPGIPGGRLRVELPAQSAETGTTPATPPLSSEKEGQVETPSATAAETKPEAAATAPKPEEAPHVAVLSPSVKLDMVRAVRRGIADESAWLPGKVKGAATYAGKMQDGELVLLEANSPEATRLSLIGAFLREMEARRVVKTAVGRKRFLDEEIPEAIRELLLEQMSEEERERAEDPLASTDALSISHAQCLAVLDLLEARYSQRVEERQIEQAKRRLGSARLPELVNKLEKKVPLTPEEVATALYHELMDVRRRLDRLESRTSQSK